MKDVVKKALGSLAPLIGTAIGGPFGGAAGSILKGILGGDGDVMDKVEEIVLGGDPEQLKQIKLAEMEFKKWMREMDIREQDLIIKDRASARDMYAVTKTWVVPALATINTVAFFALVFIILDRVMSGEAIPDNTYLGMVIAAVIVCFKDTQQFFFGSSLGSKEKTRQLANGDD